jgi:hypothetical protein
MHAIPSRVVQRQAEMPMLLAVVSGVSHYVTHSAFASTPPPSGGIMDSRPAGLKWISMKQMMKQAVNEALFYPTLNGFRGECCERLDASPASLTLHQRIKHESGERQGNRPVQ